MWFDSRVVMPTSCARTPSSARPVDVERFHVHRPIRSGAHDLRQTLGVVLVGLVHLHPERGARVPGVEANNVEPPAAQLMHKPRLHRPGLDADPGVISRMPLTVRSICPGSVAHGPRHIRRPVSSTTQIAFSFCDTSKPTNQVIKTPPMVRTAGRQHPDRCIMENLCPRRDYPMSTHAPRQATLPSHVADNAALSRS